MKDPSFNSRFRALVSRYIPLDDVVYATNSFCETQSAYKNNDITYCAAIPERQNCISKLSIYNDEQRLCNYLLEDKLWCNIKFAKSRIDPTYCIDEKNWETYTSCLFDIENLIKRWAQMSKNFELTSCERITKDSTKTFCKRIYYEWKDSIEQCKHRFYDNQISSCYSNRYINQAQKKLDHNYCLKSWEYKQESMSYSSINSCLMKVAEKTFDTDICKNIKEEYSFTISRCIANTKISEYIKNEHQWEKVQWLNRIWEPIRISLSNGTTLNFDLEWNIIN